MWNENPVISNFSRKFRCFSIVYMDFHLDFDFEKEIYAS